MKLFQKPLFKLVLSLTIFTIVVALGSSIAVDALKPGTEQPVPFSHHVHATTKKISCFFCHPYSGKSSNPGMPPVAKCMLCHKNIASEFPPIAKLRGYYERKEGVPWVKVTQLPDFVHFSHQCHISHGIDCGRCHGDVKSMDRVKLVHQLDMRFCIECHKEKQVSTDCYICHY